MPPLPPAAGDDKDNAALYLRFMRKALEKGEAYLEGELARLNKMAEKAMSGEPAWVRALLPRCVAQSTACGTQRQRGSRGCAWARAAGCR